MSYLERIHPVVLFAGLLIGCTALFFFVFQGYQMLLGARVFPTPQLSESIVGGKLDTTKLAVGNHTLEFRAKTTDGKLVGDTVTFATVAGNFPGVITLSYKENEIELLTQSDDKQWKTEKYVMPTGYTGDHPEVYVDAQGTIHMLYREAPPGKKEYQESDLVYAFKTGGQWQRQYVDKDPGRIGSMAMATDANGKVHIVYNFFKGEGRSRYATNSSGQWKIEEITSDPGLVVLDQPSIGIDASGAVHTVFSNYTTKKIYYATRPPNGVWQSELIDTFADSLPQLSMALDSHDHPHIIYTVSTEKEVRYLTKGSQAWQKEVIGDFTGALNGTPSIELDSMDIPNVILLSRINNSHDDNLFHLVRKNGNWAQSIIDSGDLREPELAIDATDSLHISFNRDLPSQHLNYGVYRDGKWSTEKILVSGQVVPGPFSSISVGGSLQNLPTPTPTPSITPTPSNPTPFPDTPTPLPPTPIAGCPAHKPWYDVTGDYVVAADDTVEIINAINAKIASKPGTGAAWQNQVNKLDVDGDGVATATDVITIINFINAHPGDRTTLPLCGSATPST